MDKSYPGPTPKGTISSYVLHVPQWKPELLTAAINLMMHLYMAFPLPFHTVPSLPVLFLGIISANKLFACKPLSQVLVFEGT